MALRRMFSLDIVDTDLFLDMPASSQNLYFHLGMRADDDGFVSSPKRITTMASCSNDDLTLLIVKGFIIQFESGVCVISEWKVNNYIQKDRYRETKYLAEKSMLKTAENSVYSISDTQCIQYVSNLDTQVRLGKKSKDKVSICKGISDEAQATETQKSIKKFIPPTIEEVSAYCKERRNAVNPQRFIDFYSSKNWMIGKNKMTDWEASVRTWEKDNGGTRKDVPSRQKNYNESW